MADGADPHRATGAPPRRGRGGTPLRAGDSRIAATIRNRFTMLRDLEEEEAEDVAADPDPAPPLRDPEEEDVAAGRDPGPIADVTSRRRRHRHRLRQFAQREVKRSIREYLDARPCMKLRATSYNILDVEDPTLNGRAAELGTESQLPNVITEQASVAAAHPRMVPTESRHEASAEEIIPNGTAWMNEEVMLCFKKYIAMNRHLADLEDYCLDELQHQCFNVESYDKVYHHYNFTVRMKMAEADWKVKLYFAEVKEVFREKYYLCYPLDPNENGQCYACKNQGVDDLRHPAIDLYETGSPDT